MSKRRSINYVCAVLDCACSSTVCGQQWLKRYLESLSIEDQAKVEKTTGVKVFKFGGGETLTSLGCYKIPAVIADKEVIICTDVVNSDIPLLLSLDAMKKAKIKLFSRNLWQTGSKHSIIPHLGITVSQLTKAVCQLKRSML